MSEKQQSHGGTRWVVTRPGTVVCSSGTVSLAVLTEALGLSVLSGEPGSCRISRITTDSRDVCCGALFIALPGTRSDGHDFIDQAVAADCGSLLVEQGRVAQGAYGDRDLCIVESPDTRVAYAALAEVLFGFPATEMTMFAVTGTNGKTSVSYLLEEVLRKAGRRPGVLGTINYRYLDGGGREIRITSSCTTPEPLLLQETLRKMADSGVESVVMEVSSHGLEQNRIGNLLFDVVAFTNLSRDHLDYHHDMESYFAAKSILFTRHLHRGGTAVISSLATGCKWSERLHYICRKKGLAVLSCGIKGQGGIFPLSVSSDLIKSEISLQTPGGVCSFSSPLLGDFNVANLQITVAMAQAAGLSIATICSALESASGAPGRLQRMVAPCREGELYRPAVFVDYAHTPDALQQVLITLGALPHRALICVFGCGGDRDAGKRPLMGGIAARYADVVLVTDDNPRSESSASILHGVAQGTGLEEHEVSWLATRGPLEQGLVVLADRHQAIAAAIGAASAGDIVLIAGKGHEDYQLSAQGRRFFDDALEAVTALNEWRLGTLLQATMGELLGSFEKGMGLGPISTDSRTISNGQVFVALTGENFEGHSYLQQAMASGAACLVLSSPPTTAVTIPVVLVQDTEQALGDLARYRRAALKGSSAPMVVGITGSSGKTTVKEMTAAIFTRQWPERDDAPVQRVLKTKGNFNNLIGLPLSVLPLRPRHRAVILEMGMNAAGEIARLTEIADPDVACLLNVHGAHLQGLGDIEGVAKAKAELFAGCGQGAVLVVNGDDPLALAAGLACPQRKVIFGLGNECGLSYDVTATKVVSGESEEVSFMLGLQSQERPLLLKVPGAHNVLNALAAAAIALAAGIDIDTIVSGLSSFRASDRRMQICNGPGGSRIINDTYNANPQSMEAGLVTLCGLTAGTRLAILGDMLELGPESAALHRTMGGTAADSGVDFLGILGEFAQEVATGALDKGMDAGHVRVFAEQDECLAWMEDLVAGGFMTSGSYVLVKGSRGMHLEDIVVQLSGDQ